MAFSIEQLGSDEGLTSEFKELCLDMSKIISACDIPIRPFVSEELPIFSKLDFSEKKKVIDNLSSYKNIYDKTIASGGEVDDSKVLIWHAIQSLGLRPTSDLFNYLTDDHVVEIHDQNGIQIFRNVEFFNYSSYSFEEFYCCPWNQLFAHDGTATNEIFELVSRLFSGKIKNVIPTNIRPHDIVEVSSICKYKIRAQMEWIAPLFYSNGQVAATILFEKGTLLNPENKILLKNQILTEPLRLIEN